LQLHQSPLKWLSLFLCSSKVFLLSQVIIWFGQASYLLATSFAYAHFVLQIPLLGGNPQSPFFAKAKSLPYWLANSFVIFYSMSSRFYNRIYSKSTIIS